MGQGSRADLLAHPSTNSAQCARESVALAALGLARVICRASRPSVATGCGLVLNYVDCDTHSSQDPHEHMLVGEVLKHKARSVSNDSDFSRSAGADDDTRRRRGGANRLRMCSPLTIPLCDDDPPLCAKTGAQRSAPHNEHNGTQIGEFFARLEAFF